MRSTCATPNRRAVRCVNRAMRRVPAIWSLECSRRQLRPTIPSDKSYQIKWEKAWWRRGQHQSDCASTVGSAYWQEARHAGTGVPTVGVASCRVTKHEQPDLCQLFGAISLNPALAKPSRAAITGVVMQGTSCR